MAADPPSIIALMSKLTGNVDAAKIMEYAPGELKNLPGFDGGEGNTSTLGGFDAYQIGGSYAKEGVKRMIAQKTVVIPGQDGVFVLQLNADGLEDQMGPRGRHQRDRREDHDHAMTTILGPTARAAAAPARTNQRRTRSRRQRGAGRGRSRDVEWEAFTHAMSPRLPVSMAEGYPVVLKQFLQFCLIIIYPAWVFAVLFGGRVHVLFYITVYPVLWLLFWPVRAYQKKHHPEEYAANRAKYGRSGGRLVGLFNRSGGARASCPRDRDATTDGQATVTTDKPIDKVSVGPPGLGLHELLSYHWAGRADSGGSGQRHRLDRRSGGHQLRQ